MDTIKSYLDNMFKGLPNSNNVKDAKIELFSMMEDKFNELILDGKSENEAIGIVISQFGNLEEVSEALGIKSEVNNKNNLRVIDLEEAKEYIETTNISAKKISFGIMLIMIMVAIFIFLSGLSDKKIISETSGNVIGVSLILISVAYSVYIFISSEAKLEKYEI